MIFFLQLNSSTCSVKMSQETFVVKLPQKLHIFGSEMRVTLISDKQKINTLPRRPKGGLVLYVYPDPVSNTETVLDFVAWNGTNGDDQLRCSHAFSKIDAKLITQIMNDPATIDHVLTNLERLHIKFG